MGWEEAAASIIHISPRLSIRSITTARIPGVMSAQQNCRLDGVPVQRTLSKIKDLPAQLQVTSAEDYIENYDY